jgi:hypothetical protein
VVSAPNVTDGKMFSQTGPTLQTIGLPECDAGYYGRLFQSFEGTHCLYFFIEKIAFITEL